MTHEIYEAMKGRMVHIGHVYHDNTDDCEITYVAPTGWSYYRFVNDGLNEGLEAYDVEYIDSIVQAMSTRNMWNICQRFYGFLRGFYGRSVDERLLANRL